MKKLIIIVLAVMAFAAQPQLKAQTNPTLAFDHIIDSFYKADEPGGVALVAQHGNIIYNRPFGMANLELNVPMQPDMLFEIGSMTKQFTSVCILQLMEQGKLDVKEPINKYIADAPAQWQPVTIEHLLTHTSGITDMPGSTNTLKDIISLYTSKPLTFTPGTKRVYSNIDYNILGFIIEKVSGMPYQDYLEKNILAPLGMAHTFYGSNSRIIPGRVPAYTRKKSGKGFENSYMFITPSAAGALLSTTADLLKWNQALITGKLVRRETLNKAWASYHLTDGKNTRYGYGWQTDGAIKGSPVVEHGGVAVGYLTDAMYLPKEDIYVAVLTNQRGILPEIIAANLAAVAIGKPMQMQEVNLTDSTLQLYAGVYRDNADSSLKNITLENHHLYYQRADGGPKMEMKPYAADCFFSTILPYLAKPPATGSTALQACYCLITGIWTSQQPR